MKEREANAARVDLHGKSLDDAMLDVINRLPLFDRQLMCDRVRDPLSNAPLFRVVDGAAVRRDA